MDYLYIHRAIVVVIGVYAIVQKNKVENGKTIIETVDKVTDITEEIIELFNFNPTYEKKIEHI